MSASLLVDARNTLDYRTSVAVGSGSNLIVGQIVDFGNTDTFTNVFVAGGAGSGACEVRIQCSNATTSGSFTDPTSGLAQFPTGSSIQSGGIFFANSGLLASGNQSVTSPVNNAPTFCSGGIEFGGFQRTGRYARLVWNSGAFPNFATAGFVGNKMTTGSGGGFSFSPTSGPVNV